MQSRPPHKKVFLTGGSGFVGRQILKCLRLNGHDVTVAARPGSFERAGIDADGLTIVETRDLFAEGSKWWQEALAGHDVLIHAAWYVLPGKYLHARQGVQCAAGSLVMAEAAVRVGVSHLVGIGTCMEYRLPSDHLNIDAPLGPANLYAASKLATFLAMQRHSAAAGMRFSWCRLFYLYGEAEDGNRLAAYIGRQLAAGEIARLSAGTQLRDYLDVADAGRMIAAVADTGQQGVINICSGRPVTVRQFAERIADDYGRRDLLAFSTDPVPATDPAAVVGVCNWRPLP